MADETRVVEMWPNSREAKARMIRQEIEKEIEKMPPEMQTYLRGYTNVIYALVMWSQMKKKGGSNAV